MPWQRHVLGLFGELLDPDEAAERAVPYGTPAYRRVVFTVPRQAGKTTVLLSVVVDRGLFWQGIQDPRPQRMVYTAQTGMLAREKMLDEWVPMLEASPWIAKRVRKIKRGAGHEIVEFSGGLIRPSNNTEAAGHGRTLDLSIIDEAFDDEDHRREQAMVPAMQTRQTAQLAICSTAGTAASLYLHDVVKHGRKAAEDDKGTGTAYVEYSAPPDADPYDEDTWWQVHPALGYTTSVEFMREQAEVWPEPEFRRAFLNIPTDLAGLQAIDPNRWAAVNGDHPVDLDASGLVLCVDVSEDRERAAIAIADRGNPRTAQLTDYNHDGGGIGWARPKADELADKVGARIVYDAAGPVANIAGPNWHALGNHDVLEGCATLYDLVTDGDVRIRHHELLDKALKAAPVRRVGDRWAFIRKTANADTSPLIALTHALTADPDGYAVDPFII